MQERYAHGSEDGIEVLVSEVEIDSAVRRIADELDFYSEQINGDSGEKKLLLLGILKGSVVFLGDLLKRLKSPFDIDYMRVSASERDDGLDILLGLTEDDITDKNIVIIEDIIDSARTVSRLVAYLKKCGAESVKVCTLLDKPSMRTVDFTADFVGFEIPDEYVVGYGLDHEGRYRALPYIGVLRASGVI